MPSYEHKCTMEEKHLVSRSAPREHHKFFELPDTNVAEIHSKNLEASTSDVSSRGRSFHKDTRYARTRSLSPGPRKHAFASSYANPGDLGFSPRSTVKRMDDPKSMSQIPNPCLVHQILLLAVAFLHLSGLPPNPSQSGKRGNC